MKKLLLVVACLLLSCSQPSSGGSTPAPIESASSATAAPPDVPFDVIRRHLRPENPPPPAAPDPRTPTQLAQAACTGGKCKGSVAGKRLLGATTSPIIPPSWTVPNWYIDPANSTTCASDTNSGTAATCSGGCTGSVCTSGVGPIVTFSQLGQQRWGTYEPRIQQQTTLTFLSSQTTNTDPVIVRALVSNQSQVVVQGLLNPSTQLCSGTLNAVTAKARTTSGSTIQSTFTLSACVLALGQMVVNTTHPGRAWLLRNISAGNWLLSQPMAQMTATSTVASASEVDTWANGDSVTVYAPTAVNVVDWSPHANDLQTSPNTSVAGVMLDFTVFDPQLAFSVAYVDQIQIGSTTQAYEVSFQRVANFSPVGGLTTNVNDLFIGGMLGGPERTVPVNNNVFQVQGGAVAFGTACYYTLLSGAFLDADFSVGSCNNFGRPSFWNADLGLVNVDTSAQAHAGGLSKATSNFNSNVPVIYGAGTLSLDGQGRLQYPAGAGKAAATFNTATLKSDNQTLGCSTFPASSTITCNLTFSAAQADTSLGAASGCLGPIAGATICNFGP